MATKSSWSDSQKIQNYTIFNAALNRKDNNPHRPFWAFSDTSMFKQTHGIFWQNVFKQPPRRILAERVFRVTLKRRLGQKPSEGLVKRTSWTNTLGRSR